MRIALLYDGVYPYTIGGVQRRIYDIGRKLVEFGHEAHIFCMKYWKGPDTIVNEHGVCLHGVCKSVKRFVGSKRSLSATLRYSLSLPKALLKDAVDIDVIDSNWAPILHNYAVKAFSIFKKKPLVITWDQVWGEQWYRYLGSLRGRVGAMFEKILTFLPELAIALSKWVKNALVSVGVPPSRIRVVEKGIDLSEIQTVKAMDSAWDVIFVGRLVSHKHPDILLKAIFLLKRELPDIRCAVIGDGPERGKLVKMVKELGLEDNVALLGFRKHEEVIAYMKSSRVFVLPSTREGVPTVILEANAAGLPVILVNHPSNMAMSMINNGENGFICDLSEHDIANRIYALLTDEALWKRMRKCSLEFASRHDLDNMVRGFLSVYEEAAAMRS